MVDSFSALKKNRASSIENLKKEVDKMSAGGFERQADDRYWTITRDKAGVGSAVIRFLPPPEGEDVPWVRIWDHGFQGPGGWYIEKSLTTIGQQDPVNVAA